MSNDNNPTPTSSESTFDPFLDRLPPEMLSKILSYISLQQTLQLRAVSRQWASFIEDSCSRRTTLKLFLLQGNSWTLHDYCCVALNGKRHPGDTEYWALKSLGEDDDLQLSAEHFTTDRLVPLLGRLFPALSQLIIWCKANISTGFYLELSVLLSFYRESLTALSIGKRDGAVSMTVRLTGFGTPTPTPTSTALISSIAALKRLTRLDLFTGLNHQLVAQIAPILSHLNHFSLVSCYELNRSWTEAVHRPSYAPQLGALSPACSRLTICTFDLLHDGTNQLALSDEQISRLTHLVALDKCYKPALDVIWRLPALEYLTVIGFNGLNHQITTQLLANLATLKHLTGLRLNAFKLKCTDIQNPQTHQPVCGNLQKLIFECITIDLSDLLAPKTLRSARRESLFRALSQWFPRLEHFIIVISVYFVPNYSRVQHYFEKGVAYLPQGVHSRIILQTGQPSIEWDWKTFAGRHRDTALPNWGFNDAALQEENIDTEDEEEEEVEGGQHLAI